MKLTLSGLVPLIIFLLIIIAVGIRLTSGENARELPSQLIDRPFPPFALPDLLDESQTLDNSHLRDQVMLVNIFGSWCVACNLEHPILMRLARDQEIMIIGVNWRDTRDNAHRWLARGGNPYTRIIFDADSTLAIDLGVTGAPESFIVDKNGQIRYKYIGPLTEEVWQKKLRPLIVTLKAQQ